MGAQGLWGREFSGVAVERLSLAGT